MGRRDAVRYGGEEKPRIFWNGLLLPFLSKTWIFWSDYGVFSPVNVLCVEVALTGPDMFRGCTWASRPAAFGFEVAHLSSAMCGGIMQDMRSAMFVRVWSEATLYVGKQGT